MAAEIMTLRKGDKKFLDDQTKLLVTDMMFYNAYTDIYTIVIITTNFKANGFIDGSKTEFLNIKGKYYEPEDPMTIFRLVCEIMYVVILCLYLTGAAREIMREIITKFDDAQKEESREVDKVKKKEERLKR